MTANKRYHAPRILGWIDLPGSDHAGLLFQYIDGYAWDVRRQPELIDDIAALLPELHRDRELAVAIGDPLVTRFPCHWDLWSDNVMLDKDGEWCLLDWDGVRVGDEAGDYEMLVWPMVKGRPELGEKCCRTP